MRRLAVDVRPSAASTYERPVRVDDDDEVATLGRAFNEAGATVRVQLSEIRAREETLRKFVADTTHDVAIPMSVLQGHLSSLDEALAGRSAPESDARSHLQDAIKETHYMASLLRNLAVATKLGEANAPLAIGPVNLSALVERVIGRHRPIARASRVELDFAVPASPLVQQTDATLLEQAVGNLVDNAIRYNREGGHVAVVLDDTTGGGFVLTVTDDGPGVTVEELSTLTTRWFRGSEARTRRPDGKGLGLAIASEACQRLGLALTFNRPAAGGLEATIAAASRAASPG
jgi:signal transduction histidine kinase